MADVDDNPATPASGVSEPLVDVEAPEQGEPGAPPPSGVSVAPITPRRRLIRALVATTLATAVVTLLSRFVPDKHSATAVGVAFLGATWWLVLRHDEVSVREHGLSMGGLLEPTRLDPRRLAGDALRALLHVLPLMAVVFPIFWFGYRFYWHTRGHFVLRLPESPLDDIAGQFIVIALPEEAFFRGYLQTELDLVWPTRFRVLGAELGLSWIVSAALFAIGHFLTIPHPARLAVFFPALLFGWLRSKTRGIGAGVVFHASCNLFAATLAHGYRLH